MLQGHSCPADYLRLYRPENGYPHFSIIPDNITCSATNRRKTAAGFTGSEVFTAVITVGTVFILIPDLTPGCDGHWTARLFTLNKMSFIHVLTEPVADSSIRSFSPFHMISGKIPIELFSVFFLLFKILHDSPPVVSILLFPEYFMFIIAKGKRIAYI